MRIFLLPISTRRALIYCQRLNKKAVTDASLVQKAINKVPQTWAKWETAESGWKKALTRYGNQGLQRIPYQEWGLKSFPALNAQVQAEEWTNNEKFDLVYPENIVQREDVPKILRRLASERKQLHWRRFIWSLIGLPFTIPFAVVPIIPNIPFFYLAFRCYSHWRALKGSDHLDFLVDNRLFRPVSMPEIKGIYEQSTPNLLNSFTFVTRSQVLQGTDPEELMLLKPGAHKLVAEGLQVPQLAAELERAIRQVMQSLEWEAKQADQQRVALVKVKENADEKEKLRR